MKTTPTIPATPTFYSYAFDFHNSGTEHGVYTEAELVASLVSYAEDRAEASGLPLPPVLASAIASKSPALESLLSEWLYGGEGETGSVEDGDTGHDSAEYAGPHEDDSFQWEPLYLPQTEASAVCRDVLNWWMALPEFTEGTDTMPAELFDRLRHAATPAADSRPAPAAPPRIIVHLEGGLVQSVLSDVPAEYAVLDYDTEGADADEVFAVPQGDGDEHDACNGYNGPTEQSARFADLWKACAERPPVSTNAGCDRCGTNDREDGSKLCADCAQDMPDGEKWVPEEFSETEALRRAGIIK